MFGPFFSPGYFARSYFPGTGGGGAFADASATLAGVGELVATALGFGPSDRYAVLSGVGSLVASITGASAPVLEVRIWDGSAWQTVAINIWDGAAWT